MSARRLPASTPFFASSFLWNLGLGMTHLLLPLYAYKLGFSGVAIGSLVALPVLVQICFNLLGGAYTDRVGGKLLALISCAAFGVGGVLLAYASTFAALLVAQMFLILSRAMFWPATWALGSQLPGDRSAQMGRLNAITSAGQILGTIVAGWLIVHTSYRFSFWVLGLVGGALAGWLMWVFDAPQPHRDRKHPPIFAAYGQLMKRRSIYYGLACAYVSALPFSLSFSFYPILLVDSGFSSDAAGALMALRAVGSVLAGFVAGRYVHQIARRDVPLASGLVVALSVLLVAATSHPVPISIFLFGVGLGSGVMTLYFQLLISELSSAEQRGSALALGGLGWGLSHFSTPLIMGALKDEFGIRAAFYILGTVAIAWTLALLPLQRWAIRDGKPL